VLASQLPVEHWHIAIGGPTLADAIRDRLVHNAYAITLKGESMRKRLAKKPEAGHHWLVLESLRRSAPRGDRSRSESVADFVGMHHNGTSACSVVCHNTIKVVFLMRRKSVLQCSRSVP